ncbi:MAG: AraC family transcriptional regulator ligand-binding domain-containing protein [Pseudomonadota bacterium]
MNSRFIPVTSASGIGPLPHVLKKVAGAGALESVFKATGLPLSLIGHPDQKIPMAAMIALFHEGEKAAADELFGLRVGLEMKPGAYGLWTRYSGQGKTAANALARLCQTIGAHQSGGAMNVCQRGEFSEWNYYIHGRDKHGIRSHAEHVVPVMVGFLRPFLGDNWIPDSVGLPFDDDGLSTRRADLLPTKWFYSRDAITLMFPSKLLRSTRRDQPDPEPRIYTRVELYAERSLKEALSPENAVRSIIQLRLMDGSVDIDGAARLSGQSLRTFQRTLDRTGTSYSELLTQVRKQRAIALLHESELSIMEIGLQLGFSDAANFTRAFRAWTGINPSRARANLASLRRHATEL